MDSPRTDRLGVVERLGRLRRRFQKRHQHRDLQTLHRFRRRIRAGIHPARRRVVVHRHGRPLSGRSGTRFTGGHSLCQRKRCRSAALGGICRHRPGFRGDMPPLCRDGSQRLQNRFLRPRRPTTGRFHLPRCGDRRPVPARAQPARYVQTHGTATHLPEPDQFRGCLRIGTGQMDFTRRGRSGPLRRNRTVHPPVCRTDGLHTGSHAQRHPEILPGPHRGTDEPRHALPPDRRIHRLRIAAGHALRQPREIPRCRRVRPVHRLRPDRLGPDLSAGGTHRRICRHGTPQRRHMVPRRTDRLERPNADARSEYAREG